MSTKNILEDLGLTKSKADVYLAALAVGSGSAQEIANRAGLPRTTTHEILQTLVGMSLIGFVTKGRTRIYSAEPPEKLKILLKEKEARLEKALPELSALFNTSGIRPRVRFYEGEDGIKTVFEDTLTVSNKLLRSILSMKDLYEMPGKDYVNAYTRRRIAAGIKLRVVRSEGKEVEKVWPASTRDSRDLHYAPDDMFFPMTVYIYDNKLGLISSKKENFGMIIESPDLYQTMKNMFEVMWQVTRVMKPVD
ncbi:helix-turn-helix domain-containing protein [Candidatus Falkowbacteria bacterium]|nr:helix-turn-helix domain-containing protein [Candidatus Falkowbacteria bacterium]